MGGENQLLNFQEFWLLAETKVSCDARCADQPICV